MHKKDVVRKAFYDQRKLEINAEFKAKREAIAKHEKAAIEQLYQDCSLKGHIFKEEKVGKNAGLKVCEVCGFTTSSGWV